VDQYATHVLLLEQGKLVTCTAKENLGQGNLSQKIAELIEKSQEGQ
jgi:hypothetical protein